MEIVTITQIREKRDSIREKIKSLNLKGNTASFGNENEYSFKGLIGGIEAILTDISTLTKAPKKFVKISTGAERKNIVTYLTHIERFIANPQEFIAQFEALKILLRSYNIRNTSERQIEFENEIEEVRKIKLQLQQELIDVEKIRDEIDTNNASINEKLETSNNKFSDIESELEAIIERKNELIEESEMLDELNTSLKSTKEIAEEHLEEITTSLTESKSSEKLITSFANKVQERENRLNELEQKTEENNTKLNEYEKERKSILQEANKLIESAKKALNYKTAEGISASFQGQYENSKNKLVVGGWIG